MLAADVDLDGAVVITGSEKADKIAISAGAENGTVILRGVPGVAKNTVFSGVNVIVVDSRGGNDDIRIGSNIRDTGGTLIGVTVNAGTGNDRVEGSDGDDDIEGGLGNDFIWGRGGDDEVSGGGGHDDCRGDAGDDAGEDDGDDESHDDDHAPPSGGSVVFSGNAAEVTGSSSGKNDKQCYMFTAPTTGVLTVTLRPGAGGRYAELELEDVLTSADLLELEPSEGGSSNSTANVVAGRLYRMRLKSSDLAPVSYTVDLSIAPTA